MEEPELEEDGGAVGNRAERGFPDSRKDRDWKRIKGPGTGRGRGGGFRPEAEAREAGGVRGRGRGGARPRERPRRWRLLHFRSPDRVGWGCLVGPSRPGRPRNGGIERVLLSYLTLG